MNKHQQIIHDIWVDAEENDVTNKEELLEHVITTHGLENQVIIRLINLLLVDGYELDEAIDIVSPEFGYNKRDNKWIEDDYKFIKIRDALKSNIHIDMSDDDITALAFDVYFVVDYYK